MKKYLQEPIQIEDLADLKIGDQIYYTGLLATGRDDVHHRVVHQGMACPVDLAGRALFHAGPIVKESPGKMEIVAVGPTSSIRMESMEAEFLEKTGVKLLIGKGAMGPKTIAACQKLGAIHCIYPGGCAVKAGTCVEEILDVKWRELGMPECMWVMRVKNFGPLVVSIDTHGNSLFKENSQFYASNLECCAAPIRSALASYMG